MLPLRKFALVAGGRYFEPRGDLVLETAALRQQLARYERRCPNAQNSDRVFWLVLPRI